METRTYTVYKFNELPDEAKQKAIEKYPDINVEFYWWEFVYEDAENVGLKIISFDIGLGSYCNIEYTEDACYTAHKIKENHGETCDTYQNAINFLAERDKTVESAEKDENGDFADEYELDKKLDQVEDGFLRTLSEDYRIALQKEYEHLTSNEAIIETLEANDYDFTEDGEID